MLPVPISRIVVLRAGVVARAGPVNAASARVFTRVHLRPGSCCRRCARSRRRGRSSSPCRSCNKIEGRHPLQGHLLPRFRRRRVAGGANRLASPVRCRSGYCAFETTDGFTLAWTAVVAVVAQRWSPWWRCVACAAVRSESGAAPSVSGGLVTRPGRRAADLTMSPGPARAAAPASATGGQAEGPSPASCRSP